MSDIETTFALLVEGDPVPTGAMNHPEAWGEAALLEEIRARRASMPTDSLTERQDPAPPRRQNRRGLVVAAAAFAVVLLLIGVVAFVGGGDPEVTTPPATTELPSPTASPTTVPDPTPPPTTSDLTSTTAPAPTTTTDPPRPLPYPAGLAFDVTTIATIPQGLPGPLAYGADGALYVGDWGESGRIYRVELDGTVELWAESDLLVEASAAAFGPDGRLYVSGSGATSEEAIVAVDATGAVEVVTEDVTAPTGVFFTPEGRLLVLDADTLGAVVEIMDDGSVVVIAQEAVLSEPTHMTLDDEGNLYVVSLENGRLYLVDPSGELTFVVRFEGAPVGMVYLDGALYVADWGDSWIYRYDIEDGSVTTVAGNGVDGLQDGPGLSASLGFPDSLALGPDGAIYFVQGVDEDGGIAVRVMTRTE